MTLWIRWAQVKVRGNKDDGELDFNTTLTQAEEE